MAGVQHGEINEIQRYVDARYVSASEASCSETGTALT